MARLLAAALVALAAAGVAVAAPSRQHATVLHISAIDGIKYSTTKLKAKPGVVTIVMTNKSALSHDVAIKGKSSGYLARGKVVPKGGTSTASATLKKGTYQFLCTVPGHAAAGMKGTLTVG